MALQQQVHGRRFLLLACRVRSFLAHASRSRQVVALNPVAVGATVCGATAFSCVGAGLTWGGAPMLVLALLLSVAAVVLGVLGRERLFRAHPAGRGSWMATLGLVLGATIVVGAALVASMPLTR